jgi:hypothetical protein
VTIDEIRRGGPQAVCEKLLASPAGGVVIVNAAAESDMHVFVAGLLLGMSFHPGKKQKEVAKKMIGQILTHPS